MVGLKINLNKTKISNLTCHHTTPIRRGVGRFIYQGSVVSSDVGTELDVTDAFRGLDPLLSYYLKFGNATTSIPPLD